MFHVERPYANLLPGAKDVLIITHKLCVCTSLLDSCNRNGMSNIGGTMNKILKVMKDWSAFSGGFFLGTIYGSVIATLTCMSILS